GVEVKVHAMTFVADSVRRHADSAALARDANKNDAGFANAKDEVVVYVTGLRAPVARAPGSDNRPALTPDPSPEGRGGRPPVAGAPGSDSRVPPVAGAP